MEDFNISEKLSNGFFRVLWQNSPDNMFVIKRIGGVFYISSVNPAQEKAVNLKGSEINGRKLSDVFPQALYGRFADNYSACLDKRAAVSYEESFLHPDGYYTYWETLLLPVFSEDGEYVYGICRDITPLREAEQKYFELSRVAEQAGKSKISFLANMSHEMRTPLNGITSAVSLFLESEDHDEKKRLAKVINSSVEALSRITNDVLDFARLNSGTMRLEFSEVRFRDLSQHVSQIVSPMKMGRDVLLFWNVSDDLPEILYGDSVRIGQIMTNIVGNAIKFTNDGEVRVSVRGLDSDPGQVRIEISVSDTGIGIHENDIADLFQPFSQIDSSSTRNYSGAGLGLAISRQLAELMGGFITVKSSLGQGSTFKVILPLKTSVQNEPVKNVKDAVMHFGDAIKTVSDNKNDNKSHRHSTSLSEVFEQRRAGQDKEMESARKTVLVVEDNHVNSMVASMILEKGGFLSVSVANGRAAVEYCMDKKVDAVLMDWHMPVMDGLEATRIIRKMPDRLKLPIIGLTANALKEHTDLCLAAGMNDVLTKPINREQMLAKIRFWIGNDI